MSANRIPTSRRRALVRLTLGMAGLVAAAAAWPQAGPRWPEKPVRLVVAGVAGGSADIVARLLGDAWGRSLGQPVIVDPRPGAAGALAVGELARAPTDGHTLLVGVNSLVSEVPHIVRLRIDIAREIRPLAELARGGLVLLGTPGLPARALAELIAYVKARPGQLSYASYSPGTMSHVLGLLLNRAAGLDLVHAGYKGSTPALADLTGGHIPLMFDGIPTALPLIRSGKVRAFAVSTPQRFALLPGVPTFRELGYPQLEALAWMGLWTRPAVPDAVQARVREAALAAFAQPALHERLREVGFEPGAPRGIDDMIGGLQADHARVGAVLKSIGFKPE